MWEWLQNNLLGVYGAVVGTIALFLNFGNFWLTYIKSIRKLSVKSSVENNAQEKINELGHPPGHSGDHTIIGPVYKVVVTNISHIALHINDVGVIVNSPSGRKKLSARVIHGQHGFLSTISECGGKEISAGSSQSFSVFLERPFEICNVLSCYAVNQLGKEFKGKHISNTHKLTLPDNIKT